MYIEKLTENGFQIKYTHPNLLWISWQHYIPHYERANIKKKFGVNVDGFGNVVKKKDKKKDTNSLLLKDKEPSLNKILKDKNKDFKKVSTYKPTGNLIYNTKLLETIENKVISTNK